MKKLRLFALGLLGISLMTTSCQKDEDENVGPTLSVMETGSGSTGGDITVEPGAELVFEWDARKGDSDLDEFDFSYSGSHNFTVPSTENGNELPYSISNANDETYIDGLSFNADLNEGVTMYTFKITDKNGESKSVSFEVTVAEAETPMNNEVTGAFFHIGGSNDGAYDLVEETPVPGEDVLEFPNQDMKNTDEAGEDFTGSWETGAGNATMYVKVNGYDYDNASVESAMAAYDNGSASASVNNPAEGDVFIAKLRGGDDYAVIKITENDSENDECACGNTGKLTFDFKKE